MLVAKTWHYDAIINVTFLCFAFLFLFAFLVCYMIAIYDNRLNKKFEK